MLLSSILENIEEDKLEEKETEKQCYYHYLADHVYDYMETRILTRLVTTLCVYCNQSTCDNFLLIVMDVVGEEIKEGTFLEQEPFSPWTIYDALFKPYFKKKKLDDLKIKLDHLIEDSGGYLSQEPPLIVVTEIVSENRTVGVTFEEMRAYCAGEKAPYPGGYRPA
jgi:hypothetical protein